MEDHQLITCLKSRLTLTTNGHDVTQQLETFKRDQGISILVAICGSADVQLIQVEELLNELIKKLAQFIRVAILTGGTRGGIPEAATRAAHEQGMKVIAIVPACAKPHNLLEGVDLRITVDPQGYESTWGSESALMMGLTNGLVLIGGGAGTLAELSQALKINSGRTQTPKPGRQATEGRPPIVIAPIAGSGGVADLSYVLLATSLISLSAWERTFPQMPLRTGIDVANFLMRSLDLYETIID